MEISGFDELALIGVGANARVFAGRDTDHDRRVAIKVIQPGTDLDAVRRRFERERKSLGRLSEVPNIVDIYASGFTTDSEPYLVMPKLVASLQDSVDSGATQWRPAAELMRLVSAAIDQAHNSGILHLDLKPANILIDGTGAPQVADFGIAEFIGSTASKSGALLTPDYSAPERFDDATPSESMDIYALGACLFALLSGSPPFSDENTTGPASVMRRILQEPVPVDRLPAGTPPELVSLIVGSLAKDPADRPATAGDFRMSLDAILSDAPPVSSPKRESAADTLSIDALEPQQDTRSVRPLTVAIAALAVVGLIAFAITQLTGDPEIEATGQTQDDATATSATPSTAAAAGAPAVTRARTLTINDGVQQSIETTLLQSGGSRVALVEGDPRGDLQPNGTYIHERESDEAYTFRFVADELSNGGAPLARWNITVTVAASRDLVLTDCPPLEVIGLAAEVESSSVAVVTWGTNTPATELVRSKASDAQPRFSNPSGNFYEDFTHRLGDLAWSGIEPLTAGTDYELSVTLTSQCDPTDSVTESIAFTTAE